MCRRHRADFGSKCGFNDKLAQWNKLKAEETTLSKRYDEISHAAGGIN
jgi:hypothetical protein